MRRRSGRGLNMLSIRGNLGLRDATMLCQPFVKLAGGSCMEQHRSRDFICIDQWCQIDGSCSSFGCMLYASNPRTADRFPHHWKTEGQFCITLSHVCINACLSNNAFNLNGWLLARVGNYWSAALMPQPVHCDGNVFPPFSFPPPLSTWPLWPAVLVSLERIGLAVSAVSGVRAISIVVRL